MKWKSVCARIVLAHVAGAAQLVERVEVPARDVGLGARQPLGRAPDGERLEREPHLEEVAQLVGVEIEHPRALVRHVLREPERLQLPDRLPDRRDAHPERAGELVEPQRRSGRQLAEDDRLAQLLERVFGHRPVAHPAFCGGCHARNVPQPLIRCQTS